MASIHHYRKDLQRLRQKLDLAYHLMIVCENVWTPLLDAQMALSKLHLCALVWEAWTDFGSVGAGRRAVLGKSDKISQVSGRNQVSGRTCRPA